MSGKLCLTPTPISSDIPNKVCVDQTLAEDTENSAELSQSPTKEKVCTVGGALGDHGAENMRPLKIYHQLDISQKDKNKTSHDTDTSSILVRYQQT